MVQEASLRIVQEGDMDEICALEELSYPEDEAASPETLRFRARVAPELFWVLRQRSDDKLLGFACGTAAPWGTEHLEHATMAKHDSEGTVVCIHSVVISPQRRRQGLGSALVRQLVDRLREYERYDAVLLLAKKDLVSFYEEAGGFACVGESAVQHGKDVWYELRLKLR